MVQQQPAKLTGTPSKVNDTTVKPPTDQTTAEPEEQKNPTPEKEIPEQEKTKKKKEEPLLTKKTTRAIGGMILLLVVLFLSAKMIIPRALIYVTKATKSNKYSLVNSYVFGAPLVAPADGKTKVRINAFILNDQGLGVPDKQITANAVAKDNNNSATVDPIQPKTDKFGKAIFEISSQIAGQFIVSTSIDGNELPQTVTITFR